MECLRSSIRKRWAVVRVLFEGSPTDRIAKCGGDCHKDDVTEVKTLNLYDQKRSRFLSTDLSQLASCKVLGLGLRLEKARHIQKSVQASAGTREFHLGFRIGRTTSPRPRGVHP